MQSLLFLCICEDSSLYNLYFDTNFMTATVADREQFSLDRPFQT